MQADQSKKYQYTSYLHTWLQYGMLLTWNIRDVVESVDYTVPVHVLATESPVLETFQNCLGFADVVLKTESCIMRAN